MAKRLNPNQLDLFEWAKDQPEPVLDCIEIFKLQKLKAILWRKRVSLGVYAVPSAGDIVEIRKLA